METGERGKDERSTGGGDSFINGSKVEGRISSSEAIAYRAKQRRIILSSSLLACCLILILADGSIEKALSRSSHRSRRSWRCPLVKQHFVINDRNILLMRSRVHSMPSSERTNAKKK